MRKYNLTIDVSNPCTIKETSLIKYLSKNHCKLKMIRKTVNNNYKRFLEVETDKDHVFKITEQLYKDKWSFTTDFYIILSSYGEFLLDQHGVIKDSLNGDFEGFLEDNKDV